jgi:hypothetical protein
MNRISHLWGKPIGPARLRMFAGMQVQWNPQVKKREPSFLFYCGPPSPRPHPSAGEGARNLETRRPLTQIRPAGKSDPAFPARAPALFPASRRETYTAEMYTKMSARFPLQFKRVAYRIRCKQVFAIGEIGGRWSFLAQLCAEKNLGRLTFDRDEPGRSKDLYPEWSRGIVEKSGFSLRLKRSRGLRRIAPRSDLIYGVLAEMEQGLWRPAVLYRGGKAH